MIIRGGNQRSLASPGFPLVLPPFWDTLENRGPSGECRGRRTRDSEPPLCIFLKRGLGKRSARRRRPRACISHSFRQSLYYPLCENHRLNSSFHCHRKQIHIPFLPYLPSPPLHRTTPTVSGCQAIQNNLLPRHFAEVDFDLLFLKENLDSPPDRIFQVINGQRQHLSPILIGGKSSFHRAEIGFAVEIDARIFCFSKALPE